jgi:hypothetical protein
MRDISAAFPTLVDRLTADAWRGTYRCRSPLLLCCNVYNKATVQVPLINHGTWKEKQESTKQLTDKQSTDKRPALQLHHYLQAPSAC